MKTIVYLVILNLFILNNADCQIFSFYKNGNNHKNDIVRMNLSENIKKIKQTHYDSDNENGVNEIDELSKYRISHIEFNKYGNIKTEIDSKKHEVQDLKREWKAQEKDYLKTLENMELKLISNKNELAILNLKLTEKDGQCRLTTLRKKEIEKQIALF